MAEYIDRNNLPKIPKGLNEKTVQGFKMCLKLLKELPTEDVVPRSEVEELKSKNEILEKWNRQQAKTIDDLTKSNKEIIEEFIEKFCSKYEVWTDSDEEEFNYSIKIMIEVQEEMVGE